MKYVTFMSLVIVGTAVFDKLCPSTLEFFVVISAWNYVAFSLAARIEGEPRG